MSHEGLKVGELYLFSNQQRKDNIWGLYQGLDEKGEIMLETATSNFELFHKHITLPPNYMVERIATRSELRDFAYNMGYSHV